MPLDEVEDDVVQAPEDSIRGSLSAALEEHGEPVITEAPVDDSKTDESSSARLRDELGRFSKAQKEAADAAAIAPVKPVEPATPVSDQKTETPELEAATPITFPTSWSAEKRDLFTKLPPEAREYITQRDRDVSALITRKSQEVEAASKKSQAFEVIGREYGDVFEPVQGDIVKGLRDLATAQRRLDYDPERSIQIMAASYGYEVTLTPKAGRVVRPQVNPELYQLKRTVEELQQQRTRETEERAAQFEAQTEAEVVAFAEEKDASGALKHPHLEDVAPYILSRIDASVQLNPSMSRKELLERLYDEGVWANPTTRARLLESQKSEASKADEVARAERAGSSIRGVPGAGSLGLGTDNLRDTIRAAMGV